MEQSEDLALRLLSVFKKFKRANFQEVAACRLTAGQIGLLHMIYFHGRSLDNGISIAQLVELSNQTSSALTQMLNSLEKDSYIIRSIDPKDRRIIRIHLTPMGGTFIEEHHRKILALSKDFIDHIGSEKIETFIEILDELIKYREEKKRNG